MVVCTSTVRGSLFRAAMKRVGRKEPTERKKMRGSGQRAAGRAEAVSCWTQRKERAVGGRESSRRGHGGRDQGVQNTERAWI